MKTLERTLRDLRLVLAKRPVALIFAEDGVALDQTILHHLDLGFARVVVFADPAVARPVVGDDRVDFVDFDCATPGSWVDAANAMIAMSPGIWFYAGFNAEYLHFPFCETRSVGEFANFITEERRVVVAGAVVDLYPGDPTGFPGSIDREDCHLDTGTYFAIQRTGTNGTRLERQLDFYGGLRWRFEEHLPEGRRRIDRVALFRAAPGLEVRPDGTFNDDAYNTIASPWHNSPTAATCSFRVAKALKINPASAERVGDFTWEHSRRFEWSSRQLMDLGLMEPGQWF